jgi:hypothetical protein
MNPLLRVGRRGYALAMVLLFVVLPLAVFLAGQIFAAILDYATYINTALFIVIALVTGGRFADAGYPRWAGILAVFAIGGGIPICAALVAVLVLRLSESTLTHFSLAIIGIAMAALLALVVWAGTRKPEEEFDPQDTSRRIEPRF